MLNLDDSSSMLMTEYLDRLNCLSVYLQEVLPRSICLLYTTPKHVTRSTFSNWRVSSIKLEQWTFFNARTLGYLATRFFLFNDDSSPRHIRTDLTVVVFFSMIFGSGSRLGVNNWEPRSSSCVWLIMKCDTTGNDAKGLFFFAKRFREKNTRRWLKTSELVVIWGKHFLVNLKQTTWG